MATYCVGFDHNILVKGEKIFVYNDVSRHVVPCRGVNYLMSVAKIFPNAIN